MGRSKGREESAETWGSFEEAEAAFEDPFALSDKERVVDGEQRWKNIAMANGVALLLIVHMFREEQEHHELVRLISARKADRKERKQYEKQTQH